MLNSTNTILFSSCIINTYIMKFDKKWVVDDFPDTNMNINNIRDMNKINMVIQFWGIDNLNYINIPFWIENIYLVYVTENDEFPEINLKIPFGCKIYKIIDNSTNIFCRNILKKMDKNNEYYVYNFNNFLC